MCFSLNRKKLYFIFKISTDDYTESYDTTAFEDFKKLIPKDKYTEKEWPSKHRKGNTTFKNYHQTSQSKHDQQLSTTRRDRRQLGNNDNYIHHQY